MNQCIVLQNLAFRMHAHPLALKNGYKHEFFGRNGLILF